MRGLSQRTWVPTSEVSVLGQKKVEPSCSSGALVIGVFSAVCAWLGTGNPLPGLPWQTAVG